MRSRTLAVTMILVLLAVPATVSAAPPSRPLALTPAQFDHLQQLETEPAHAAVLDVHATYQSEREQNLDRTRLANDTTTGATLGGIPTAIILVLICAAPL